MREGNKHATAVAISSHRRRTPNLTPPPSHARMLQTSRHRCRMLVCYRLHATAIACRESACLPVTQPQPSHVSTATVARLHRRRRTSPPPTNFNVS
nr:hypothetical protein Itr_chr03CG06840 [Ipomoea trifida]